MKARIRWQTLFLFLLTALLFSCDKTANNPMTDATLPLIENGTPKYVITRGDDADETEIQATSILNKALSAATGMEFTLSTDW